MEFARVPDPTAAAPVADPVAVIRAHLHALTTGNATRWLALFSRDAKVFDVPADPDRLVGEPSPTMGTHEQRQSMSRTLPTQRPARVELVELANAGDLVAAKTRTTPATSDNRPSHELALYRVRDGVIHALWRVARADTDPTKDSEQAEEVIADFTKANNRGDVEAFLKLFSHTAKNFRSSDDLHAVGDKPSVKIVDAKSRRDAYVAMFAGGAPAQVETISTIALGNMIVARDVVHLPDGKVTDGMSAYRIERGLIERDWYVFERARF
jgi:hypothetical protein